MYKVQLARLMIRNPQIFIIDQILPDITSSSEYDAIMVTLTRMTEGRTALFIPNDTGMVVDSDHIAVFDEGVILSQHPRADLNNTNCSLTSLLVKNCHWFKQELLIRADSRTDSIASK